MEVSTLEEDNCYIIALDGDLDVSSSIAFDKSIEDFLNQGNKNLLIDCRKLNYIASAGLGVIVSHLQEFEEKSIKMVIFGLNKKVLNVFQILGLDQLVNINITETEAKEAIKSNS
ncbi:MAG: STAS domain-containing protein [Verrucomicrobia bacterium]|nr:STAS domain-containing protein [Cytophagales bacterium]